MKTKNIVIVGVGGQGTLLAGKIIGTAAMESGYDVKVSEVHGMAQRGGSVITYVRYGDKISSPLIENGEADMLLAFEQMECLRWAHMLKKGGTALMNTQKIAPMPVIAGAAAYPDSVIQTIKDSGAKLITCDAVGIAAGLGNVKAVNVVLIGVAAKYSGLEKAVFVKTISETVKPEFVKLNLAAFEAGYAV